MKVYAYYLVSLPDEYYSNATEDLKYRYLRSELQGNRLQKTMSINVNGRPRYLFGFTNKKKIRDKFEEIYDMDHFIRIENDMSDEAWQSLAHDAEDFHLVPYAFFHNGKIEIPLPEFCVGILQERSDDIQQAMIDLAIYDYGMFKQEYIMALDMLGYTFAYQIKGIDAEFYEYNMGYGCTPEGAPSGQVEYCVNRFPLFLETFSPLLRKGDA